MLALCYYHTVGDILVITFSMVNLMYSSSDVVTLTLIQNQARDTDANINDMPD
jgi:hypothetical protein